MIAHGFTDRTTRDIDLFTEIDNAEAVRVVALRDALRSRDIQIRDAAEPRDHRFIAVADGTECLVETFVDALTAIRRLRDADWSEDGIDLESAAELTPIFEQWNRDLRDATG